MKHIPNILSGLRLVLIPFFVWFMWADENVIAGAILLVSAVSDMLDGMLARRFNWVTQLGKVLDPVADKLTHAAVSITLLVKLPRYWPFFALLLLKDAIMLIFGANLMKKGVKLEGARWFGKVSTVVYFVTMLLVIFFPALPMWVVAALLALATVCALVAGFLYVPQYKEYRREAK